MLDWAASILELSGDTIIGNKNKYGFILKLLCNVLWILYVFLNGHTYGLLLVVCPAVIINIRNFIKWKKIKSEIT